MEHYSTLGDFIRGEAHKRDMSIRAFAEHVGVSHSTLNRLVNNEAHEPSMDLLMKLARVTHTDLCVIVALYAPSLTTRDTKALMLASRIERLGPSAQELIDSIILGEMFKRGQQPPNAV